jgi:hypothetical protein
MFRNSFTLQALNSSYVRDEMRSATLTGRQNEHLGHMHLQVCQTNVGYGTYGI